MSGLMDKIKGKSSTLGESGSNKKKNKIDEAKAKMFGVISLCSVVIAASIVVMGNLWGLRGFHNRVIDELKSTEEVVAQNAINAAALDAEFKTLEGTEVNSKQILDSLPSVLDFPALATSVEKLVEDEELVLESFSGKDDAGTAEKSAVNPEPVELPFSIVVTGRYDDIQKFILSAEQVIRPLVIQSVEMKGSDKAMSATINYITYYQPTTSIETESKSVR